MTLRISATAPQFTDSWENLRTSAQTLEALGYDGLFLFDHLVPIGDPSRPVFELCAALGAIASSTTRLRVGSLVMRVPLRGAGLSAAIARTAAAVAPGRFVFGVGAGDRLSAEEGDRFGITSPPLAERVASVGAAIEEIRTTDPEVPVWVGGTHESILDLVRRFETGWNGWGIDPETFAGIVRELPAVSPATWGGAVVIGRNDAEAGDLLGGRRAIAGGPDTLVAALDRYVSAGAEELVVSVLPNDRERWELFASEVLGRLR